jgi:hypothetical protein
MPAKMAQISPLGRRSGCQNYGRRPRRQAVRGNSAKIHLSLGFIWGIPVESNSCDPVARWACRGQRRCRFTGALTCAFRMPGQMSNIVS